MCDFTMKAFELAFKYRNPAVVLADGVLGQMIESLEFPEKAIVPEIDNTWAVNGTAETRHNLITSIFLDFNELENFNERLQAKYELITQKEVDYEEYLTEDASVVLVSYGISSRICRSAVDLARKEGIKVGLFRPKTLFPFPEAQLKALANKGCSFISVEMSNGQMRDDIRLAIGCSQSVELVNRMGGNLITLDQIMDKIRKVTGEA
jgi:2-oxoisovalerate ferredoxin oxidoreductase alpha subunit